MNLFDSVLKIAKAGKLVSSYCNNCDKYIWPPKYYCNYCNLEVSFRDVRSEGIVLEKGYSNLQGKKRPFAIGEFNGIRILGSIDDDIMVGESIRMQEIRVTDERLDIKFVRNST